MLLDLNLDSIECMHTRIMMTANFPPVISPRIAALDPSDMASTLAQNNEQHEGDQAITMSDLPPSSVEETTNAGTGPDSSQDFRTSSL